jgi:hypothetical protein
LSCKIAGYCVHSDNGDETAKCKYILVKATGALTKTLPMMEIGNALGAGSSKDGQTNVHAY